MSCSSLITNAEVLGQEANNLNTFLSSVEQRVGSAQAAASAAQLPPPSLPSEYGGSSQTRQLMAQVFASEPGNSAPSSAGALHAAAQMDFMHGIDRQQHQDQQRNLSQVQEHIRSLWNRLQEVSSLWAGSKTIAAQTNYALLNAVL